MSVKEDLIAKVLPIAVTLYVARAGEPIPSSDTATGSAPEAKSAPPRTYDHNDAVDDAVKLINAAAVRSEAAFNRAASESKTASLLTAVKGS